MAQSTYFFQECPTCGRHLRIRVEYLGRAMACAHCSRTFTATDRVSHADPSPANPTLLERADRLLSMSTESLDLT
jgi:DNA-directed RNA polymerase subunit RPC12/RpoP